MSAPVPTGDRPLASVSLDVDNLWSYMKTAGVPGWEARPSYLDAFVPAALEALEALDLRITFFLVGADCAREENRFALRALATAGHEIGNHSHEHEPWLARYPRPRLEREIAHAEEAIERATGQRPIGFRGPGFGWSPALLEILEARGYLYDASTFPTYLGPFARAYYFWNARGLSADDRRTRGTLFGTFADGLHPVHPYRWRLPSGGTLLEIPVTTMPVVKAPFHLTYLVFLSRYSERLAMLYLRAALRACRLAGVEPSFLLHPTDLIGGDLVPQLRFFPGMDLPTARKRAFFDRVLRTIGEHYTPVPMGMHARSLLARSRIGERALEPARAAAAAGGR